MYADTGVTIRAAIPWVDAESRLNLISYSGTSRLWEARVFCISPTIFNVTFPRYNYTTEYTSSGSTATTTTSTISIPTAIAGDFSYSDDYPALSHANGSHGGSFFNCSLPVYKEVVICSIRGGLPIDLQPPLMDRETDGFMVMKLNLPIGFIGGIGFPVVPEANNLIIDENKSTAGWSLSRHGPWSKALNGSNYELFSASACFTKAAWADFYVSMSGFAAGSEPKMGWSWDPSLKEAHVDGSANTSEIRLQLGVTSEKKTLDNRSLLALDPLSGRLKFRYPAGLYGIQSNITLGLSRGFLEHDSINFPARNYLLAHDAQSALFLDIMNTTNNPAYALQALSTTLYQIEYFDTSYKWTVGYPATYVFSQEMSIPVHKLGLTIVVVIVAAHVIVVGTTVTMFLLRTRETLLGNVWQSVAQVISDRTTDILWRADSMTDKEVKKALSSGTVYDPAINSAGVIRRSQNGRNEFGSLTD
ncbi:hypothetical protein PG984_003073 [Apiospora sp. TS-2023a]